MSDWTLWLILAGVIFICLCVCVGMWMYTRSRFIRFSDNILNSIRLIENGETLLENVNEDSLEGKINAELAKLCKAYHHAENTSVSQKKEVQQIVSDISHQLKTPIANIVMYNDMVLGRKLERDEEEKYLLIMRAQVEKLHILVQDLVKMSRMESAMIVLEQGPENLYQCLAQAVAGITAAAERKGLHMEIECPEESLVWVDKKWTVEAIGNVPDNAVKYTGQGGHIYIRVNPLEMFTRVDIEDDGIGIEEKHYSDIFKRFWREAKVHENEGVGIGLYLTREILTRQGGYVKVESIPGEGSCFSLYLPSEKAGTL